MSEELYDNPAGRLFRHFEQFDQIVRKNAGNGPSNVLTVGSAWQRAFAALGSQNWRPIYCIVEMHNMMNDAEAAVRRLERFNHDRNLVWMEPLERILGYSNLDADVMLLRDRLSPVALHALAVCAEKLHHDAPEQLIAAAELENFHSEALRILKQLSESDLPVEIKTILQVLMKSFANAIMEYQITGIDGLRSTVWLSFEQLQRMLPKLEDHRESAVVAAVWDFVSKFDTVTSVAVNVPPIFTNVIGWLNNGQMLLTNGIV